MIGEGFHFPSRWKGEKRNVEFMALVENREKGKSNGRTMNG